MKKVLLAFSALLFLTGCSSSPAVESAESIVQRACETRTKDNYSALAQSLFVEAANLNENYRELARANGALIAFGNIVPTVEIPFIQNHLLHPSPILGFLVFQASVPKRRSITEPLR